MIRTRYARPLVRWPRTFKSRPDRFESPWVETSRHLGHVKRVFWFLYSWRVWSKDGRAPLGEGFALGFEDAKARIHHEIHANTVGRQRWMPSVEHKFRHLRKEGP